MRRTGTAASIVASPVLVGAITSLVIIVAVFLAYNANQGLPFVPTYDIKAELPSGANLVGGNDVRVGGYRVGQIVSINPGTTETPDGKTRAIAVLGLKLDQTVAPLPVDTEAIVRTRSALGLKYLELDVGMSDENFAAGDTIPLKNAGTVVEFDDFLNTFGEQTRRDQEQLLSGFGDALAGQGPALNEAIGALPQFFGSLTKVMDALNDPSTQLNQFFTQIGAVSAELAPVAAAQAELFTRMADTFEAFNRDPAALRATITETPPTLAQATTSFAVQRPFLDDFAELSAKLHPAVNALPHALPDLNDALDVGEDVLPRTVSMSHKLEGTFEGLDDLGRHPDTLAGAKDIRYTFAVLNPLINYAAPTNTVCNYTNYFFTGLGEHISQQVDGGTSERIELNFDNFMQPNRLGSTENARPASVPLEEDNPYGRDYPLGPATRPNAIILNSRASATFPNGKANCNTGQFGYAVGPISDGVRYTNDEEGGHLGIVNDSFPVRVPTTFTGVPSLKKVDSGAKYSLRKAP
jgi:virulence factor Mce-like protein